MREKLLFLIVPRISSLFLRFLAFTTRKEVLHQEWPDQFWNRGQNFIVAFWHQRLLMLPFLPHRGRWGMLISQHRDGEFIARTVRLFGIDSVRGSTTRGSLAALRGMVRFYRAGGSLAITPDGPQGPKYVVQMGAIELARQTGAPLLPVTYGASRKKVFQKSWDNFILPFPFSKVVYLWGEPLWVPRDINREGLEEKRRILQERLRSITEEVDRIFQK